MLTMHPIESITLMSSPASLLFFVFLSMVEIGETSEGKFSFIERRREKVRGDRGGARIKRTVYMSKGDYNKIRGIGNILKLRDLGIRLWFGGGKFQKVETQSIRGWVIR